MSIAKAVRFLLLLLSVSLVCNSNAQTSKIKKPLDSSKSLVRKEKIKFPLTPDSKVLPINWYNFNAQVSATFTFTDSLKNITSKTIYDFYLDKSSDYVAMKEQYEWKSKVRTSFRLEELKDSIAFRASLNDTARKLTPVKLQVLQSKNSQQQSSSNITSNFMKLGKTEIIHGFLCEAYIMDNEQFTNILWVTTNKDPFLDKIKNDLRFSVYNELTASPDGIVMVSECYYKQTKHTQRFEVTAVHKNAPRRFVTRGMKLLRGF